MRERTYENIICEEEHNGKECIFPKKVLTKLKMLAAIGTISILAVVTFSGCTKTRNNLEQLTTEPTTTYVQMMEEPTTTPTKTDKTTQQTTYETTTKKEIEQTPTTTTKPVETEKTTIKETEQEVEKTTHEVEQKQDVDKEYNNLFQQLNNELNKKTFPEEANKLFIDTLKRLYENYPEWQKGYKDLPNREEYIKSNLIDIIKEIYTIEYYKEDSKEANELYEEGSPSAWTTFDENDNLIVGVIAKEADKSTEEERNINIERFYHEIIHCKQKDIIGSNYFDENEEIEEIYLEGGATFHMKFTNPYTLEVGGIWSVENEKGDLVVNYNKDNCVGYLLQLNAYEKLVYLVGYTTMDKVEKGEIPLSTIEETIGKKYGAGKATEFLNIMKEWKIEYDNSYKGDEIYNLAIELENKFLEFVKQDINSLETKQQIEEYKAIWERYETKNLPQVIKEDSKDITNETFNIDSIKESLKNKEKGEYER